MSNETRFSMDVLKQYSTFKIVFVGGKQNGKTREVNRLPPVVNMEGGEVYNRMNISAGKRPNSSSQVVAIAYVLDGMEETEVLNVILEKFSSI